MRISVAPALALALLAGTAAQAAPGKVKGMEIGTVGQGAEAPGHEVIETEAAWKKLCARMRRAPEKVDFSKSVVVALFAGRRMTGGHGVEYEAAQDGKDLVVTWRVRTPGRGSIVTMAITHPFKLASFPRPAGKVVVKALPDLSR